MSDTAMPPLFGTAPPLSCSRLGCGADATWHVIWSPDMENGLTCEEHAEEVRRLWAFWSLHRYELTCSMPGKALFHADVDRCVLPEPTTARAATKNAQEDT